MFRISRLGAWMTTIAVMGAGIGCPGGESYVAERPVYITADGGSRAGEACTLDSECGEGMRCQGGVCVDMRCDSEDDCREGELCMFGECQPDSNFECTADTHPIIDLSPPNLLDFGVVVLGATASQTLKITNMGSCLLTLQGIGLSSTSHPDFSCNTCEVSQFPKRLAPNRSLDVIVKLTPTSPGPRQGELQVRSDDENFPTLKVALVGKYEGTPRFLVEPEILDFGYVDFSAPAPGNKLTKKIRLSNVGDGNALLTIKDASLRSAGRPGFTFSPAITFPDHTVVLKPTQAGSATCLQTGGCVDIEVTFTPTSAANYDNDLIFTYDPAPQGVQPYSKVMLKGYSTTPPRMQLSEKLVDFGERELGSQVDRHTVTITNTGQTEMTVQVVLEPNSSTDFSVEPLLVADLPVRPGGNTNLRIHYDPTVLNAVGGTIRVATNDPTQYEAGYAPGTQTITVRGYGKPSLFDDLLKVEMTFENGDNGFFGNDFRDVNLHMEGPSGLDCTEPLYSVDQNGQITGIITDYCASWSATPDGIPQWVAIGAAKEPERIILVNAGLREGDYKVMVSYEEDCASIPSGMLADLLGLGVDALVGYISGGTIDLGAGAISDFIANNCWDHASSNVTITIFINGTAALQCPKRLNAKGTSAYVAKINRHNGAFTAECL